MRNSISSLSLVLALSAIAAGPTLAVHLDWQVLSSSGSNDLSSSSLRLGSTVGQTATGTLTSSSLHSVAGFWQDFGDGGGGGTSCCVDRVGDANQSGDDEPTIGDVTMIIDARFITGTCDGVLQCLPEADINQTGGVNPICDDVSIGDLSWLIDYLFITGQSRGLPNCL